MIMMAPTIGVRPYAARIKPFLLYLDDSQPPPRLAAIWTAPTGIPARMVWKGVKPKDLMIKGPNVASAPDVLVLTNVNVCLPQPRSDLVV